LKNFTAAAACRRQCSSAAVAFTVEVGGAGVLLLLLPQLQVMCKRRCMGDAHETPIAADYVFHAASIA
jgi:hypothetical protein